MRPQKAWIAVIHWSDDAVEDADELRVFAESAQSARSLAKKIWTATKGADWPHCRTIEIQVFPQSRLSTLA